MYLYALAAAGQKGVERALGIFRQELERDMKLMGCTKISELNNISNLPFDVKSLYKSKEFEDTNKIFEKPDKIDIHITHFLNDNEIKKIAEDLKS